MTTICTTSCTLTHDGEIDLTVEVGTTLNQRLLELIAAVEGLATAMADMKVTHEVEVGGVLDTFLTNYLANCCP